MSHPPKKIKLSDLGEIDVVESGCGTKLNMLSEEYTSPVIVSSERFLDHFRRLCDFCMDPPVDNVDEDDDPPVGGIHTLTNAGEDDRMRELADLCLKLYNGAKLKDFKLVKICKVNFFCRKFCLTFRAEEAETGIHPLFRGIVSWIGGEKALFCEIKDKDEVTLLPGDDELCPTAKMILQSDGPLANGAGRHTENATMFVCRVKSNGSKLII